MADSPSPSTEEWAKHISIIKLLLYIHKRPLPVVRRIMSETCGFNASESAYKRRISEHGWAKNHKPRGPEPIPATPDLPIALCSANTIFRATHVYFIDSFGGADWECNGLGEYQRADGRDQDRSFEEFTRTLQLTFQLFEAERNPNMRRLRGYWRHVATLAVSMLSNIAKEQHPLTLIQVLALADKLIQISQTALLRSILQALWYYSHREQGMPIAHPILVVFSEILRLLKDDVFDAAALQKAIQVFCKAVVHRFIEAPNRFRSGLKPFLVEVYQQTRLRPDYKDQGHILDMVYWHPEIPPQHMPGHYPDDNDLFQLYWHHKYAFSRLDDEIKMDPAAGRAREQARLIRQLNLTNTLIAQCHTHETLHQNCPSAKRGLYSAFEARAKLWPRLANAQAPEDNATNDLRTAIHHRWEYDVAQRRPYSPSTVGKMIKLYERYLKLGQNEEAGMLWLNDLKRNLDLFSELMDQPGGVVF